MRAGFVFCLLAMVAMAGPTFAQDAGPAPGPYEEKLESLLAASDTDALTQVLLIDVRDTNEAFRGLNWLKKKQITAGGSSYIAYLYSALSWKLSESVAEPNRTKFKRVAVGQFFLARGLIRSEGFQCADAGAPEARMGLVNTHLRPVGQYAGQMPPNEVQEIQRNNLLIIELSFKARENDIWLCRGGGDYFRKYFEKHPGARGEVFAGPGTVGQNRVVPLDPTIMPEFVPYDDWKTKRRAMVTAMAKQIGWAPPTSYLDAEYRMK